MRSRTLYHMFRSEIGLWSSGRVEGGDVLGISTMFACFMACGTYPSHQTLLIRTIVILSAVCPAPVSSSAVIPSGPAAFLFFRRWRLCIISVAFGGFSIAAIGGSEWESSLYRLSQYYTKFSCCSSSRVTNCLGRSFLWTSINYLQASAWSLRDCWSRNSCSLSLRCRRCSVLNVL